MRPLAAPPRQSPTPAPPPRPRPREADDLDAPAASPAADQQAWLKARFAEEAAERPALSPLARIAVALAGVALATVMLAGGALRALEILRGG